MAVATTPIASLPSILDPSPNPALSVVVSLPVTKENGQNALSVSIGVGYQNQRQLWGLNMNRLIIEQVIDLQKRTKSAIKSSNNILTGSLLLEYAKLINSTIDNVGSNKELLQELLFLRTELQTIPSKSNGPLASLKWLDNAISQFKMIIKRLLPSDIKPELELHPKVLAASGKLLQDDHYAPAVFEAFKALEEYVREKSGRNEYGEYLMSKVFNEDSPILEIKYSRSDTARDEQKGFRFIFMGAMIGIRNPKGHHTIIQRDKARTLQYLALASLLFKTVDDAALAENVDIKEKLQRD